MKNYSIPNHRAAKLSDLDMEMVLSVPQGGNWKDIPLSVPSKRLDNIRESYAQGKGSRSTYYGRLLPNMPSYTINTYFNRPGNGCHMHYDQDRVMSQREAARFQSFPDNFEFVGPQGAVNTQIGNAVPPLLAYQIAKTLGESGYYIDLFSGAGGMGLGFKWAGWKPVIANDIVPRYLETYERNVHGNSITGSITDPEVFDMLVEAAKKLKLKAKLNGKPFWVLGGPPCQGFSTAGLSRSMDDERNHLFLDYKKFIATVEPDGFVFENVAGLLNIDGGSVFERVKAEFKEVMPSLTGWVLNSEDYAIPQRRKRVILVGSSNKNEEIAPPEKITFLNKNPDFVANLPAAVSSVEAIDDLPIIGHGESGSDLPYRYPPKNIYQAFMRGNISVKKYLMLIKKNQRKYSTPSD